MTDKISGAGMRAIGDAASTRRPTRPEGDQERTAAAPGTSPVAQDTVSLTSSAVLLSQLQDLLTATPPRDADRIAAIKDAIASGSYAADAGRIAEKMLRMERDLG